MIIFNIDHTLANCQHRKHFIQKPWDHCHNCYLLLTKNRGKSERKLEGLCKCGRDPFNWEEDRQGYYEACDKDDPIEPALLALRRFYNYEDIQFWTGRCESVRDKTIDWILKQIPCFAPRRWFDKNLKMRPLQDFSTESTIKEVWLDEFLNSNECPIQLVFDGHEKSVRMWRRRGIFVFDVKQPEGGF